MHASHALAAALASAVVTPSQSTAPNIVFVMADDLGYGDVRCFNPDGKIPTPNVDRLARQGVRFTDAHAPAAVCVPTRYGLLTGRYPFRNSRRERQESVIEPGRMTVGSLLRAQGYTTACIGKWHLGFEGGKKRDDYSKPLRGGPIDRGFDHYFGIPASLDIPPYYWIDGRRCVAAPSERVAASNTEGWTNIQGAFWRAGDMAPDFRHADVLPEIGRRAVAFVRRQADRAKRKPFFLYVALTAPHTPWLPTEPHRGRGAADIYGEFVHQVDAVLGVLLESIAAAGMGDDTLVIFTSDNGPVWYPKDVERFGHNAAGPLRGMKGDAWEGGHRVPFIARWPGVVAPGATCRHTICHTDLLATAAEIVGADLPENAGEDSFDLGPLLREPNRAEPVRSTLISQASGGRVLAIRAGRWKLIPQLGSGGFSKPRRVKPTEGGPEGQLYDLDADLGERRNLWSKEPAVVARLTERLAELKRAGRSR